MQEIRNYEIRKGTRLIIVRKNGSRVAGTATGRCKEGRGVDWSVNVRSFNGGIQNVEGEEIASMHTV